MLTLPTVTEGTSNGPAAKGLSSSRSCWCTPRWLFLRVYGGVRVNLRRSARALLVDARETIGPRCRSCHGKGTWSGLRYRTSALRASPALIFCSSFRGACLLFLARQPTSPLPRLENTSLATFPLFW
ncbi:MAG: hypothetical protein ACLUDU_16380 [Butyricimonas faecihominis]